MNVYVAMGVGGILSFFIAFLLGYVVIPWLHKMHFGQTILDIGPSWHKNKQGTPTMGGILFIISSFVSFVAVILIDHFMGGDIIAHGSVVPDSVKTKFYAGIVMAFAFAFIGFADDYISVVKKRNMGLTIKQKTLIQLIIMAGYIATLYLNGSTYIFVPFAGNIDLGVFSIPLNFVIMYCTVNAVNFTDGIDGLCASVTGVFGIGAIVIAIMRGLFGAGLIASVLIGAMAGYLIWNWHPAKVFMGDTGSLFLGGIVLAVSYALDMPWLILVAGFVYVMEFGSDIIQIGYFKLTHGKRIFKMAPIHHHFEKSGWKEKKIVYVFNLITLIGSVISVLLVYFGRVR